MAPAAEQLSEKRKPRLPSSLSWRELLSNISAGQNRARRHDRQPSAPYDDIFLRMAEADGRDLPIDDAVEELWLALERGDLRLVVDGDRLGVEPFEGPPAERLLVAEQHWPLVAARRRVPCGLYEAHPQDASRALTAR